MNNKKVKSIKVKGSIEKKKMAKVLGGKDACTWPGQTTECKKLNVTQSLGMNETFHVILT